MKLYRVYAKPLYNNLGNETVYVQSIHAANKKEAVISVMAMIENRQCYKLDSYIAIRDK